MLLLYIYILIAHKLILFFLYDDSRDEHLVYTWYEY
jgi:hypothetical protein